MLMLLSRDDLVSALFRETDRAQRIKVPLALIAVGFAQRDGQSQKLDQLDRKNAMQSFLDRIAGILRSYDSVGEHTKSELLLLLPGCNFEHATALAERLRDEALMLPLESEDATPYFAVVSSAGRSPIVVLHDIQRVLQQARTAGPGSIQSIAHPETDPEAFRISVLPRANR